MRCSSQGDMLAAARAGLGISALSCFVAESYPDLVRVAPQKLAQRRRSLAARHPDLVELPAVRAVIDFVADCARDRSRTAAGLSWSAMHAFAFLHHAIIAPPQMRRRSAQRTPRLRERRHLLRGRPRLQAEADLDRLPARRCRRPARRRHGRGRTADRRRRSTGRCRAARSACGARRRHPLRRARRGSAAPQRFAREMFQRLDLGGGQTEPAQPVGAGACGSPHGRTDRRRRQPSPDRRGARGRELLAADDAGKPRKTRLAPPQGGHAGEREDRLQPWVLLDQRVDGVFEVGLGFRGGWSCIGSTSSCAGLTRHPSPIVTESWKMDGRVKPGHDEILCIMPPPVFRFAPSPNGHLHLGHAYSALLNFDLRARERRPVLAADRGYRRDALPAGIRGGDLRGSRLARHRLGDAGAAAVGASSPIIARRSKNWPRLAWSIPRSRAARRSPGSSPRARPMGHGRAIPTARRSIRARRDRCRAGERDRLIASGAPYALRLDMAAACRRVAGLTWTELGEGPDGERGIVAARPEAWGDVILARKETPTSYHLSVVVDDALAGHQRGRARAGPVSRHLGPPPAPGPARSAGTRLSPPRPDSRRRRAGSCRNRPPDRPARAARGRRHARRHPPVVVGIRLSFSGG